MKRTTRQAAAWLLCVGALGAAVAVASDANRIILRVNDRIGTLYDYEVRRDDRLRAIQQADLAPDERAELIAGAGAEVLSDMLEELLVLSRADQIDFRPSADEIDRAVRNAQQGFGIETEEQFEMALAQNGMTRESFRRQVEVNMRISGVLGREVQQRVDLSEEDLRRFYYENEEQFTTPERVRLRELVVLDGGSASPEAQATLAEELRSALAGDASLEDLAATHSAQGATSGVVDLGWVEKGDLDSSLEDAVWTLAIGDVSTPVPGRGGLHVLVVEDREEAGLLAFSDVAQQIESVERERLFGLEYAEFMRELRESAYISLRDLPEDAQGFDIEQSASRLVYASDESGAELEEPSSEEDGDEGEETGSDG